MPAEALVAWSDFVQCLVSAGTRQTGAVRGEAGKYVFHAYNLRHHHAFSRVRTFGSGREHAVATPDELTLPGYPAFLSLLLDGVPDQDMVRRATLAQAGLGVATTLLAFLVALRVLPLPWAFAAGVLVAIQPHLAVVGTYLMTGPLYAALMLAAVLAMLHAAAARARPWTFALAGLPLGACCLVRPQRQLVPLLELGGPASSLSSGAPGPQAAHAARAGLIVLHAVGAPSPRCNIHFHPMAFVLGLACPRALAARGRSAKSPMGTGTGHHAAPIDADGHISGT